MKGKRKGGLPTSRFSMRSTNISKPFPVRVEDNCMFFVQVEYAAALSCFIFSKSFCGQDQAWEDCRGKLVDWVSLRKEMNSHFRCF